MVNPVLMDLILKIAGGLVALFGAGCVLLVFYVFGVGTLGRRDEWTVRFLDDCGRPIANHVFHFPSSNQVEPFRPSDGEGRLTINHGQTVTGHVLLAKLPKAWFGFQSRIDVFAKPNPDVWQDPGLALEVKKPRFGAVQAWVVPTRGGTRQWPALEGRITMESARYNRVIDGFSVEATVRLPPDFYPTSPCE